LMVDGVDASPREPCRQLRTLRSRFQVIAETLKPGQENRHARITQPLVVRPWIPIVDRGAGLQRDGICQPGRRGGQHPGLHPGEFHFEGDERNRNGRQPQKEYPLAKESPLAGDGIQVIGGNPDSFEEPVGCWIKAHTPLEHPYLLDARESPADARNFPPDAPKFPLVLLSRSFEDSAAGCFPSGTVLNPRILKPDMRLVGLSCILKAKSWKPGDR